MQIPESARCVWKWNLFSARQWDQEMFDGSTKIFEQVKRFDSIQWIMIDGENIVLPYEIQPARTEWNYWLWGWMLEEWEIPQEAIARELLEETGMIWDIVLRKTLVKAWYISRDEHIYIIKNPKKVQDISLDNGWEKIEIRTMDFDWFLKVLVEPWFRNSTFANAMIREFILPGKQDELRQILFNN